MALALLLRAGAARAQVVAAEPLAPIAAPYPEEGDGREAQIVLQLVIDAAGRVESATEISRAPPDAAPSFSIAAIEAAKRASFRPSTRDGKPIRSRIEYVVVFHPPSPPESAGTAVPIEEPGAAASPSELATEAANVVVRAPPPPRGLGEFSMDRALLNTSPHLVTSELLSTVPGFFVDHEDAEGVGNDMHLRGFDMEHGSGIELRVGAVPINVPLHVEGSGYADLNFVIPEVVRNIRVVEGVYDPRQGDAAIAGSAYIDLGVPDRGYRVRASYGSFHQRRVVAIAAPSKEDEATFFAASWRESDGFGPGNRATASASAMGQYAFEMAGGYRGTLSLAANATRTNLAGFLRRDDFDARRVGFDDSYPLAAGQSAVASRAHIALEIERSTEERGRVVFSTWASLTALRLRQNFTGSILVSPNDPTVHPGDLFESSDEQTAFGGSASYRSPSYEPASFARVSVEPGMYVRAGSGDQSRSLLDPGTLVPWDRRLDAAIGSADAGAYVDADLRLFRRLRFAGGVRADALMARASDHLTSVRRALFGVALSPRVSVSYELAPWLEPVASYGEGFRSATPLAVPNDDARPYSKVRSVEAGLRSKLDGERYLVSLALYQTRVESELVFEAESGGFENEGASTRNGIVAGLLAKPLDWLSGSAGLTLNRAQFDDADEQRYVPEVPSVLARADLAIQGPIATLGARPFKGEIGAGGTYIAGRHVTDDIVSRPVFVLNARAGMRYGLIDFDVDVFNLLARRYSDDELVYRSNWGPAGDSVARHFSAATPFTVIGTLSLHVGG